MRLMNSITASILFDTPGALPRLVRVLIIASSLTALTQARGQSLSVDSSLGNSPFTLIGGTYSSIQVGTSTGGTGVVNNTGPVGGTPLLLSARGRARPAPGT